MVCFKLHILNHIMISNGIFTIENVGVYLGLAKDTLLLSNFFLYI